MEKERAKINLSVIVPAFNEEKAIEKSIGALRSELKKLNLNYEIIVVNDGSNDNTQEILNKIDGIKIVRHRKNKGNGAAIKTGIKVALHDHVLFFDADGQHNPEYIRDFIPYLGKYEMIAGSRHGYKGPLIRQPGKKILQWLVNYLLGRKIPDINCGLRIVNKKHILKFENLICDGFSFYTTSLLIFATEELPIKFIPIKINKRTGKSTVRPRHALDTFILIIKTVSFFNPLKVFLPTSLVLFVLSLILLSYDVFFRPQIDISESTIMVMISSLLIFFFGILADQTATLRKDILKR